MSDKPHFHGHRERLRRKLAEKGAAALADYELLELVLFSAVPRADTKPLAKALIKRFGSFAEVVSAEPARLSEVKGTGDAVVGALKVVEAAALELARGKVLDRPLLSTWQALLDYCQSSMSLGKKEQFRILFLDRNNTLVADEMQQEGTVDHTPVYPREVIKRALELGATALILVHNHPTGDPTPSKADIDMTREIAQAGEKLGIVVHDHLVIGRRDHASFKSLGLL